MTQLYYYFLPDNEQYTADQITLKTGIEIIGAELGPTDNIFPLNNAQVYPVTVCEDPFDPELYDTSVSYVINSYPEGAPVAHGLLGAPGEYAMAVYTPTDRSLATAKTAAISALKAKSKAASETAAAEFPIIALVAAASKTAASRNADVQTALDDINTVLTATVADIATADAATTVAALDTLINGAFTTIEVTAEPGYYLIEEYIAKPVHMYAGRTYRFDQSDASNAGYPIKIYDDIDKTTEITAGVNIVGTPGTAGAYTEYTPAAAGLTAYQSDAHDFMGSIIITN